MENELYLYFVSLYSLRPRGNCYNLIIIKVVTAENRGMER